MATKGFYSIQDILSACFAVILTVNVEMLCPNDPCGNRVPSLRFGISED
jgi:hypothetical protein